MQNPIMPPVMPVAVDDETPAPKSDKLRRAENDVNDATGLTLSPAPLAVDLEDGRPEDSMTGLEKERAGVEDTFDEESATFMDKN